jgi:hypothetical protein
MKVIDDNDDDDEKDGDDEKDSDDDVDVEVYLDDTLEDDIP